MKIIVFCLIVCVFPAIGLAETPHSENRQDNSANKQEVEPPSAQDNKQKPKKQPQWPRPYAPSEKISADSKLIGDKIS